MLEEQEGRAFRDRVFWLRDTAARVRAGDASAAGALARFVHAQVDGALEPFVRACSIQLQLANIAEELERLRRRRHYDSDTSAPQRESLAAAAGVAVQHPPADVAEALRRLDVRLTMTAHPTEASRRSVFEHQQSVWRAMERLDDPRLGRTQRRVLEGELREVLTVWWQTDAVRHVRPVVEDEVRRILFFFEAVLFDAAPRLEAEISRSFERSWPPAVPAVRFGSWAGGDMDGNPEVTPESVMHTLRLHQTTALRLLRARVDRLTGRYSQSEERLFVSPGLGASLEADGEEMPDVASRRPDNRHEPFRRKLLVHVSAARRRVARAAARLPRASAAGGGSRAPPRVVELAAGRGWGAREAVVPGADVRIPPCRARRPAVGARPALGDRAAGGRLCRRTRGRAERSCSPPFLRPARGRLRRRSPRSRPACGSSARRRSAA